MSTIAHKFVDFTGLRHYHTKLKESIEAEMEETYAAKEDVPAVATSTELSTGTSTEPRAVTPKLIHDYVTGEVSSGVAGLVNSAPATLDTLNELASALGNDPNFATTVSGQIGSKLDASSANYIKSLSIDGKTITYTRGDSTTGTLTTQDTTYTPASEAPKAPASTAAVGTSLKYAREDHVHPVQTTVSGNAGSATQFASNQTVALTGDVTGSASSKAGWSVATTLANSGVTADTYGPSDNASPAHGGKFTVPSFTVDAKGRITSASTKEITLPASGNTDTKMNVTLGTTTKAYLLGTSTTPTSSAQAVDAIADTGVYLDTTAGKLTATTFAGSLSGNASSATEFSANKTVELTGDVTGSASSKAGWSVATTLANSGVTASTYGNTTQQTPAHSGTFNIPYFTVDAKGRVTSAGTTTVKLPASGNTDTKVNVTLGTTSKAYLLGTTTEPTSTAQAVTSIADTSVYLDTTAGMLAATTFKGALQGNASSATEFSATKSVTLTGDVTGSTSSKAGWSVATTLANSGVTAATYGPSDNASPAHGGKFTVPSFTVDSKGRITSASTKEITLPASGNTDTKVNVTLGTTTKAYLLATSTTPTSSAQAVASIADTGVYLDTTAGNLTATKFNGDGTGLNIGSTANLPLITTTDGKISAGSFGNAANTFCQGNDSRLSNARTPVAHATSATTYGVSSASNYGHAMASSTTPIVAGTAAVGTETAKFARGDHVHPEQTTVKQAKGVFLAIPNETTQTATLTATVAGITEYFPGLTIAYRAPFNTAASSTLNINSLGAKPIYYKVNTTSKDYYPANSVVMLVYETTTVSTGCWKMVYSNDGNTNYYDRRNHANAVKAAAAVTSGTVIVGSSAGYKTAASGVTFDISYPILYASAAIAANATATNTYEAIGSVNLQTTKASWTGTQYATAYLVCTLSGTTATVDSSVFTTTIPSTADGKIYIPLGVLYSTYQIYFAPTKDIYQYTNGSFHPLDVTTAATGSSNGTIKINGTDVTVKSINTAAYKADTYFAQASHGTHVTYSTDSPAAVGTASAGSASTVARSDHVHALPDSGVTASTYGNTTQQTPSHGGTFNIPYVTVDAKGIVTGAGTTTVKLPTDNNTDTKVNVTLGTTTKAYLLGTSTTPTATAAAVASIADTGVYLDTTAGRLTAGSFAGDGQNLTFGTANAVIVTDANKKIVAHSTVSTTELGYLDGVTSAIQTQLNGKAASSHNHDASNINSGTLDAARIPSLDASKITTGTIDIARLPAGALERLVTVANQTARFALTTSDVQLGDTVKQTDTGVMYYVVNTSKLNSADGYSEYTAGAATSVPWSGVTSKPSSYTPSAHNQASNTITAMTGYSKPSSTSAIGTSDSLNSAVGKLEKALDGKAASSHTHASSEVTAMTSYSKPSSTSAIATTDSLNDAIGKLEKALDGKAASSHGTHVTYSTSNPLVAGTASAGSANNVSRGDHVHPEQTIVKQSRGVFLVIPNETTQTATLTATVSGITEYFPGLMVAYRAPFNTAANSTLNINSLGAKPIYYGVNTASKDYYPANTLVLLVYETTTASGGCWKMVYSYDGNNNNYDRRLHNQAVKAAAAVTSGTVIVGTSAGYKTAASGVTFDISYPILYASEAIAANATNAKTYEAIPSINLRTTKASWTGTQYAAAYLVGTLSGTTFTIDSSIFTTTVPSTADGKVYIPLGVLYSTYQIYFAPTKDIYQYTNGSFHPYDTTTAAAGSSNGQVKINGTNVTVYTHPTTSGNKHVPSGGSSGQFLGWSADGTAAWVGNPNWTTHLYAAAASNATANATTATTNAATYIVVCDNSSARNAVQVTGTNGTTVSAINGKLTIDSVSLSAVTNAEIDAAIFA